MNRFKAVVLVLSMGFAACAPTDRPAVRIDPRQGEVSALVDGVQLRGHIDEEGRASLRPPTDEKIAAEHLCVDGPECRQWILNVYRKTEQDLVKTQTVSESLEIPPSNDTEIESVGYVGLPLSIDGARQLDLPSSEISSDPEREIGPWLDLTGGGIAFGPAQTVNKKNPDGTTTALYGHLENDSQIAVSGPSFKSIDRVDSFLAGHMLSLLQNAVVAYATAVDPGAIVAIGGISKHGGGFNPGHSSHQNGMDADIPFMGHKTYVNVLDKDGKVTDKFNPEKNWAFFRLLYDQKILDDGKPKSVISMILVGPKVKEFLCRWAGEKGLLNDPVNVEMMKRIRPTTGHDDHMHVRLHCSPHHAACLKQNYAPKTTGCEIAATP